jgi:hypothetical protein
MDRRGGLDGSGDGEGEEPGAGAEHHAGKDCWAATMGALKQAV